MAKPKVVPECLHGWQELGDGSFQHQGGILVVTFDANDYMYLGRPGERGYKPITASMVEELSKPLGHPMEVSRQQALGLSCVAARSG